MKLNKYVVALATTTALAGAGLTVPNAVAQNETAPETASETAATRAVEGFTWPDTELTAGATVTIKPSKQPGDADTYRFVGPGNGGGFTFTTDEKTGVVTAKAPVNGQTGDSVVITTQVFKLNADKTKYEKAGEVTSKVTIVAGGTNHANNYQIEYKELVVKEKSSATANRTTAMPAGTTFEIAHKPEGYSASVDADGAVTVTPDATVGAGSTTTVRVKVTYPDTSFEYADVAVKVADKDGNTTPRSERDAAKHEPTWPATEMSGEKGAAAVAKRSGDVPEGTNFKLREDLLGNLTEYFTASVAANGDVTLTPKVALKAGQDVAVPVQVTYPDKSSETLSATFKITESGKLDSEKAAVTYPAVKVVAGSLGESVPEVAGVPEGTEFELLSQVPEGWEAWVEPTTGKLLVAPPTTQPHGSKTTLQVQAVFPDGSAKVYNVALETVPMADGFEISYNDYTLKAGTGVTLSPGSKPGYPEGTTFSGPNQSDGGFELSTDATTGAVTVKAPAKAPAQTLRIPVRVTFPDKSVKDVAFTVTVEAAAAPAPSTSAAPSTPTSATPTSAAPAPSTSAATPTSAKPSTSAAPTTTATPTSPTSPTSAVPTTTAAPRVFSLQWKNAEIRAGESATITPEGQNVEGTKFAIQGVDGWDLKIDEKTGVITVSVPISDGPGYADVKVYSYLPDRQTVERTVRLTVVEGGKADRYKYDTKYAGGQTQLNQAFTQTPTGAPQGTKFKFVDGQDIDGWATSIDANSGKVSITPTSKNYHPGTTGVFRVTATYPDGSHEDITVKVLVADKDGNATPAKDRDSYKYEPAYPENTNIFGNQKNVKISLVPGTTYPKGAKFSLERNPGAEYLDVKVDEASGQITVNTKAALQAGSAGTVWVRATYPDKSYDFLPAKVKVTQDAKFDKDSAVVNYPEAEVPADESVTIAPELAGVKGGTTFARGADAPAGWTIEVDKNGNVSVQAPEHTKPGITVTIPVVITYPDKSTDTKFVKVTTTAPTNPQAKTANVSYSDTKIRPGATTTVTPSGLPAGSKVKGPNQTANGFTVSTNADTGAVTITADTGISAGTRIEVPLEITFQDGSKKTVKFRVSASSANATPTQTTTPVTTTPVNPTPGTSTLATPTPGTSTLATPTPGSTTPATPTPGTSKASPSSTSTPTGPTGPTSGNQSPTPEVTNAAKGGSAQGSSAEGSSGDTNTIGIVVGVLAAILVLIGGAIAAMPVLQNMF